MSHKLSMSHKLFLADDLRRLKLNGKKSLDYQNAERSEPDFCPVVKIYNPVGNQVWLLTELAADGDTLFGLCDDGDGHPEIGTVSKLKLMTTRVETRLTTRDSRGNMIGCERDSVPLARDRYFVTDYPLTVWLEAAQRAGKIIDDDVALAYAAAKLERPTPKRHQKQVTTTVSVKANL